MLIEHKIKHAIYVVVVNDEFFSSVEMMRHNSTPLMVYHFLKSDSIALSMILNK